MIKIKIICLIGISLAGIHYSSNGQKSLADSIFKGNLLKVDVEGGFYYYSAAKDNIVLMPDLLSQRRQSQKNIQYDWGLGQTTNHQNLLTDNPLRHGAGYTTLHLHDIISKNFDIIASLTGELRGTSYGVYNTGNTIIFPQFLFRYHDTFTVFKRKLVTTASIGNYNNIRTDEGLIYYNIDAQALYFKISYGGFTFEHMHIADLLESIGLNIDDGVTNSFYYNTPKGKKGEIWKFGIGYDLNDQIVGPVYMLMRDFLNAYAALIPDSTSRIYLQFSNLQGGPVDEANTNAFVVGAKKEISKKNLRLFCRAELRYYGSYFKDNFWDGDVYYRNFSTPVYGGTYANSIGPNLYPLRNYERPFSQFAAFTEPELNPFSVGGAALYLDGDVRIYRKLFFNVNLDINYMTWFSPEARFTDLPNSASYTYPFYKIGFVYQPVKSTRIFAGITNKGMNLDNTYQTFYLLKNPYFYFEFVKTVDGFLDR